MAACEKQLPANIADVHHASHVRTVSLLVCGKSDTNHNRFYLTDVNSNQINFL